MIINKYRSEKKKYRILCSELIFLIRYTFYWILNGFRTQTILFYPEMPFREAVLVKIAHKLRFNVTNNPKLACKVAIQWQDVTYRQENDMLKRMDVKTLNLHCTNIGKEYIESLFVEVFGYGTFLDPTLHQGTCVRKSEENAKHDGKIIQCPVKEKKAGFIYQLVIDNSVDATFAQDIRVPVINNVIPFVYLKFRPLSDRFSNTNSHVLLEPVEKYLSLEEQEKIILFSKKAGLDYGEIDILRDKGDGRIYIVDVNNTPWGPPNHLCVAKQKRAVEQLAELFNKQFLQRK